MWGRTGDRGWAHWRVGSGGGVAGGGNSKRVEGGRNRGELCNNAAYYFAIEKGLKGGNVAKRGGIQEYMVLEAEGSNCPVRSPQLLL